MCIPDEYDAFLLTQVFVDQEDTAAWQSKHYRLKEVEEIYDAYVPSYRIAKLVTPFKPWTIALKR